MHNKLTEILALIGDEAKAEEDASGTLLYNEEEFSRRMAEEVLDETAGSEDLDLYQIQQEELAEELVDVEEELQKLALEFFQDDEEEAKEESPDEAELNFQ